MYTLDEIKTLVANEWYFLFIALFVYWVLNGALLVFVETLCKRKIRNRATANAVSIGLVPFVLIYTGSMMKLMPMFNHWHLGINILLSLLSVAWMITVYYLFNTMRTIRQRILVKENCYGWYLTCKGKVHMFMVSGFLFTDILIKTLLYRLGICNFSENYRHILANISALMVIHFHGPLPKWFIDMTNFVLFCCMINSQYRLDYNQTIGRQVTKEDIASISSYLSMPHLDKHKWIKEVTCTHE